MPGPGATTYIMINNFLIDCSISESHSFESDVTDYPVESGSNVSDNIRPLPIQVEIEGLVSNTPIGPMVNIRSLTAQFGSFLGLGVKPAEDAYELFMQIRDAREPVTIQTSLRTYENMALQSLSIPKGDHQDALRFTAKFKQIISVENVRSIRVSTPIATGKSKVTKPGDPYPNRIILIDKQHGAWWDPDIGFWRGSATVRYADKLQNTDALSVLSGKTTTTRVQNSWVLTRGEVKPLLASPANVNIHPVDQVSDSFTGFQKFKTVIAVPVSMCTLVNFIIRNPPGQPSFSEEDSTAKSALNLFL